MFVADGHVHTEWSWDAALGSMERTCARAVELGLPALAFTEHADLTPWTRDGGVLVPPDLDVSGYFECLERCRFSYPELKIVSGIELSEPHWHPERVAALLDGGRFERVLGSVHSQRTGEDRFVETGDAYAEFAPHEVVRAYFAETEKMLDAGTEFEVLAHLDYPLRTWPASAGAYDLKAFEGEIRAVLRALTATSRILEFNTKGTLHPQILAWWHEMGGAAVTFGSDAHEPGLLARELRAAMDLATSIGYAPGPKPLDPWLRS